MICAAVSSRPMPAKHRGRGAPEGTLSLPLNLALFSLAMVMVIAFGLMMTRTAAVLAERTGLGEAVMGAFLVGASTSLPGIITSVTAMAIQFRWRPQR